MNCQKNNISKYIISFFILLFNAIMIIFAKEIFSAAKSGLELWFFTVVPSLLPFMLLTGITVKTGLARKIGGFFQPVTLKIFNLSGIQAFVLFTGMTAGSPLGLKTLSEMYRSRLIDRLSACRLMLFCNNTGLMFILSTVGTGFFGSSVIGRKLLLCHILAILSLAFVSGIFSKPQTPEQRQSADFRFDFDIFRTVLENSVTSMLQIGVYIIIFSIISEFFDILHIYDGIAAIFSPFGLDKNSSRAAALGLLEVTNGCKTAAAAKNIYITAWVIGWGGLSVHAQSLSFLDDTDLPCLPYLLGKAANAALCALFAAVLL